MAEITMPKLSDTMTEGTLVSWKKKQGEKVTMGEVIADVETDKATMEMEAFEDGVLSEIIVQEGQKVAVGEKIAVILGDGETAPAAQDKATVSNEDRQAVPAAEKEAAMAGEAIAPSVAEPVAPSATTGAGNRVKASPLARKVAAASGVELSGLTGSGPGGRIVQRDVLTGASVNGGGNAARIVPASAPPAPAAKAALPAPPKQAPVAARPAAAAIVPGQETRVPLSSMRKTIADRLLQSKTTIPHFYLHIEVDAEPMAKLRAQVNAAGEKEGTKVSVNDLILKAVTKALVTVPKVNASFAGDAVVEFSSVNLAVAVAVEDGLITPVVRNAEAKSLMQISLEVKDLAGRARSKKLKPEEYQGGTFTVSNLGAYGIDRFDAIINPPQAAILSVGGIVKKPVVNQTGEIVAGQRIDLGLSCDHRVVDGALGAQYLAELRRLLESPLLLLL